MPASGDGRAARPPGGIFPLTQPANYADLMEGHLRDFLAAAARDVDQNRPFGQIEAAARASPAVGAARTVGMWVAEDLSSAGAATGAAEVGRLRERASRVEQAVAEASKKLAALSGPATVAPASAEAFEELAAVIGGEIDELQSSAARGFHQAAGAPLVEARPHLALGDLSADGNRMKFARERAAPAVLALEPVANLRQDLSRLKHYGLHAAFEKAFRPMPYAVSSSYFKAVRPPVQLEGDLFEFKALSGIANAADVWAEATRAAVLEGFIERLKVRGALALAGAEGPREEIVRALELERAAFDLLGALEKEPAASSIPAEALVGLVVPAKLATGGLTP